MADSSSTGAHGSVVGAVSISMLGEMLRPLELFKWIIIPLLLILVMIYRPTGQIMWALVDGGGQDSITLQIGSDLFDLRNGQSWADRDRDRSRFGRGVGWPPGWSTPRGPLPK